MKHTSYLGWILMFLAIAAAGRARAQEVRKEPYWAELSKDVKVLDTVLFGTAPERKASMEAHDATGGGNSPAPDRIGYSAVNIEWTMDPKDTPGPYMLFVGCTDYYTVYSADYRPYAKMALYVQDRRTKKFKRLRASFYDSFNRGKGYLVPGKGPFRFKVAKASGGGFSIRDARLMQRTAPVPEDEPVWLRDVTYTYDTPPNLTADAEHKFLTDGALGSHNVCAFYSKGITPKVTFDLGGRYLIHSVEVYVHPRNGCGIGHVAVEVGAGGRFLLVARNPKGHEAGHEPPGDWPGYVAATNINREARRVRVNTGYSGGNTMIKEIRIFGKKLPPARVPGQEGGLHIALWAPYRAPPPQPGLRLIEADFNDDGSTEVLLENDYVRAIVGPARGGVIGSFVHKASGIDFTTCRMAGAGMGLFADHLWTADSAAYDGDYYNQSYACEIHREEDRVGVTLKRTGAKSFRQYITFRKTFWLTKHSTALRADYSVDCDHRAVTSVTCGLWIHNFFGAAKGKPVSFLWPVSSGVVKESPSSYDEKWVYHPVRGWAATLVEDGKAGATFVMDYRYLDSFHSWGYSGIPFPTFEWRTKQITIPANSSFQTTAWLVPFQGLAEVAGASEIGAASLDVTRKDGLMARIRIAAARATKASLVVESKQLPDGDWGSVGRQEVVLETGKLTDVEMKLRLTTAGTYVIRAALQDNEKRTLLACERPLVFGKSSAAYVMKPRFTKIKTADEAPAGFDINYNKLTFTTPHVKWATPFAGKKVKALMLLYRYHQVEAADLAQRMDLEFDAPFYNAYYPRESLGDYYGRITEPIMHRELKKFLKGPYDVYVISGPMWQKLDDEDRKQILKQVEKGAGLIALEPLIDKPVPEDAKKPPPSPWWQALPFERLVTKGAKYYGIKGAMKPLAKHSLSVGLPYSALPPMSYSRYAPSGRVVIGAGKDGKDPLLAIGTHGKGRVLALSYRVQGAAYAWTEGGLIPWLNGVTEGKYRFPYWEYHYAWLAKCLIHASGQDMPLQLVDIKATSGKLLQGDLAVNGIEVHLRRASYGGEVVAEMTLMDRFGRRGKAVTKEVAWQGAIGKVRFVLRHLPGGIHMADVILRDASGNVLNWGSTSFDVIPPAYVQTIEADSEKFYQRSDAARVRANAAGDAGILKTATMEVRFEDSLGRLLKTERHKAARDPEAQKWCALPLADMVTSGLTVRALLCDAQGNDIHEQRRAFTVPMPRYWDDVSFRMWDSKLGSDTPANITVLRMKLLKQVGVDAINWHGWMSCPALFEALKATGMRVFSGGGGIGSRAHNQDISSEKYRNNMSKICEGRARWLGQYGSLCLIGGDENSYGIGDWKKKPAMLEGFRKWLEKEYGTLEAMNATWGTKYAKWEEVVPLNRKDLPVKNNYAPLSDVWRWNELEFAAITKLQMDATHKGNGAMRFGLSGTSDARAGDYDWWLLSQAMDMLHGYSGVQVLQRRSFNPNLKELNYIGPASHGEAQHRQVWRILMDGGVGHIMCGNLLVQPDYSPFRGAKDIARDMVPMKRGIGKILINAKRRWDPVAIHYSPRSVHAARIIGPYRAMTTGWTNVQNICRELGTQPRYLSYEQISKGELSRGKYKLLFMPYSYAVSGDEAKGIREWVENGGVVFATVGAGAMDGRCRVLKEGMLDDLFGIRRGTFEVAKRECHVVGGRDAETIRIQGAKIACSVYEPNISPAPGTTVLATVKETGSPAILAHRVGRGLAVYCAANVLGSYTRDRGIRGVATVGPVVDAQERLIESVLKRAGVVADTAVEGPDGKRVPSLVTYQYEYGGAPYVGFIGSSNVKTTFHLGAKGYVTEMLTGRSFGHTDKVAFPVGTTSVNLFSILPYQVVGIAIEAPTKIAQGARLEAGLEVSRLDIRSTAGTDPERHVLHVELLNPDGEVVDYYSQNLVTNGHKATFARRLALNEVPGTWTLRVRDAATAKTATTSFIVAEERR